MNTNNWIDVKELLPFMERYVWLQLENGSVVPGIRKLSLGGRFHIFNSCDQEVIRWSEMVPPIIPPPKPDAFEEWWKSQKELNDQHDKGEFEIRGILGGNSSVYRKTARIIWEAATKAAKEGK